MKALNYNNVKKRYLPVTLAGEESVTLLVGMPNKGIMQKLFAVRERMEEAGDDVPSGELLDDLYGVCAAAMSRNKAGHVVEQEYLEELMGLDDIMLFLEAYLGFVGEAAGQKN